MKFMLIIIALIQSILEKVFKSVHMSLIHMKNVFCIIPPPGLPFVRQRFATEVRQRNENKMTHDLASISFLLLKKKTTRAALKKTEVQLNSK